MTYHDPIGSFRRKLKSSPWLVMSLLFHLLLILGLGFVAVQRAKKGEPKPTRLIVVASSPVEPPVEFVEPPPEPRILIPPPDKGEIVTFDDVTYLPTDLVPDIDLTKPIGDPTIESLLPDSTPAASSGIGVGTGGIRGTSVASVWRRRPGDRVGPPGGGGRPPLGPTFAIDKAVRDGLVWLCRHQNDDGSWSPRSLPELCDARSRCYDETLRSNDHYDVGVTSLALLCFLGAGFTHQSQLWLVDPLRDERHRVGEVVTRGLKWLRARQNPDGSFSGDRAFMYNEALATMALSEAYGLSGYRYWRDPAQRGVDFLQRAQRPSPSGSGLWGWRYASREEIEDPRRGTGDPGYAKELYDADTSVTAWCVMALKSAQLSKLAVEPASLDGAVEFCNFVTAPLGDQGGLVGYVDAASAGRVVSGPFDERFTYHPTTMSALGMCIRIFARHDATDPFLEAAAQRIAADLPAVTKDRASVDYYYWYYASLALNQLDGPDSPRRSTSGRYWNRWNGAMNEALLGLQDHSEAACSRGGWIVNDRWGSYSATGPIYATALAVLTLEVYYRYPNAFGGKRN